MKLSPVFVFCLTVLAAAPYSMGQDTVYTWKDENGVLHYTNTVPPEGATIVDTEKELPHDPQEARQRENEQQRYLERIRQEERLSEKEKSGRLQQEQRAAEPADADAKPRQEEIEDDRNRRNETWHQNRIERRQREKLDQGPSPK